MSDQPAQRSGRGEDHADGGVVDRPGLQRGQQVPLVGVRLVAGTPTLRGPPQAPRVEVVTQHATAAAEHRPHRRGSAYPPLPGPPPGRGDPPRREDEAEDGEQLGGRERRAPADELRDGAHRGRGHDPDQQRQDREQVAVDQPQVQRPPPLGQRQVLRTGPAQQATAEAGPQRVGDAASPAQCAGVPDDRRGDDRDAVTGAPDPEAEVDVVADERQRGVQAAERVPHVPADEHPRRGHRQHVRAVVVLALVELPVGEVGDPSSAVGRGDADLHQRSRVVPAALLAARHGDRRRGGDGSEQQLQRVGGGRAVGVQQPHPLPPGGSHASGDRRAGRQLVGGPETAGHGGTETLVDPPRDHGVQDGSARGTRGRVQQHGAAVGAAGVDRDDTVRSPVGACQRRQRPGQPAGAVVHDHDRDDLDVVRAAGRRSRAGGPRRVHELQCHGADP